MTITFKVESYPRYDQGNHYKLFTKAWAEHFATGGQARLSPATQANLYENNPAGAAVLAKARKEDEWVGALSAIPFRVQLDQKTLVTAYQLSDALVSPRYQRQGILTRLVETLTRELDFPSPSIIYTFPNLRSGDAFLHNGYRRARVLPTRFYFPAPAALIYRLDPEDKTYRRFKHPVARYREVGLDEASELISSLETPLPHLIRDQAYLKWRYFQPAGEDRFRLLAIEPLPSGAPLIAVVTCHRYGRRKYSIFLELLPETGKDNPPWLAGLLRKLGRQQGCGLLYSNEKIGGRMLSPAWGAPLPNRLNPRPVELLIYPQPGNHDLEEIFLQTRFTTADWLGFL